MVLKKRVLFGLALLACVAGVAQNIPVWNGKKCAVALTYDDALGVHLDKAIPALDSAHLKGTFYLIASAPGFTQRMQDWKKAAHNGHELANHTLFHPCAGNLPGRSFVTPDYDLSTYTLRRMTDDIRMTNTVLEAVDGQKKRTFAYPCGDQKIGDSFYLDRSKNAFVAARGVTPEMQTIEKVDLFNAGSYMINGETGAQLIALVKKAMETKSFLVFLFHGVGGEHSLNVSAQAHRELIQFLKQNENQIWIAPFRDIAAHVKQYQASRK